MATKVLAKPNFTIDQMVAASTAAKRFGELRKKAKISPQIILDNNRPDSVVMNYQQYEDMFMELEVLRELTWEMDISRRLANMDAGIAKTSTMEEVLGEKGMVYLNAIEDTPDEDLFE